MRRRKHASGGAEECMPIPSQAPHTPPDHCPVCRKALILETPRRFGDALCPHCGSLFRFQTAQGRRVFVPVKCPECGGARIVRIFWGHIAVLQLRGAEIEGMPAIAGGKFEPVSAPTWVCLDCQPGWCEVHQLALEEEEHQIRVEESLAAVDFDTAVKWRDQRHDVHRRIQERLIQLGVKQPEGRAYQGAGPDRGGS